MRFRSAVLLVAAALGVWEVLWAQRPFKQYEAAEYEDFPSRLGTGKPSGTPCVKFRYSSSAQNRWGLDLN